VYRSFARLQILAALLLRIQAFWDVVQDIGKDLSAFIFKGGRVSELASPL
jgi:Ni/Fe-hydrogenase subunit HybB-like protein